MSVTLSHIIGPSSHVPSPTDLPTIITSGGLPPSGSSDLSSSTSSISPPSFRRVTKGGGGGSTKGPKEGEKRGGGGITVAIGAHSFSYAVAMFAMMMMLAMQWKGTGHQQTGGREWIAPQGVVDTGAER